MDSPGPAKPPEKRKVPNSRSAPTALALLAWWLVSLRRILRSRQDLAELFLSQQLMRLQGLKGTRASGSDAHGGGTDRVGDICNDHPVVSAEHPVNALSGPAQRVGHLPYRGGPVARALDHPSPCVAGVGEEGHVLRHGWFPLSFPGSWSALA